jgi:hypothetical protein
MSSFRIGDFEGIITGNTITVTVPYGTDITDLAPMITVTGGSVNPEPGTGQDFSNFVIYTVTADDGSTAKYTVTVIIRAQAFITIQGPQDEDISMGGFAGDSPVLSRSGKNDLPMELNITVSDEYASCAWYINGVEESADAGHDNQITLYASAYALKSHYITVVIYSADIPYSREFTFTVVE